MLSEVLEQIPRLTTDEFCKLCETKKYPILDTRPVCSRHGAKYIGTCAPCLVCSMLIDNYKEFYSCFVAFSV